MQLRICDFRNAKFQGYMQNHEAEGFGLALDENYTFVVSDWRESRKKGPGLAVFGDSTILYGESPDVPDSLLVYRKGDCKVYKYGPMVVMDCINSNILLRLEVEDIPGA
jgi:hypothetical protein